MYTPKIGDAGIFTLKEPYSFLVTPSVIYTVRSIRTLSDVISSGSDPYETYYKPLGVTHEAFLKDAESNKCIVGLQAGDGEWIYTPESFIEKPPNVAGVKYSSIVLGVGLGAIPDSLNLSALETEIKELVAAHLGVDSKIKAVLVSQPAFISHEQHERLERARTAKISKLETNYTKVVKLTEELKLKDLAIKQLSKYIKDSL